MKKTVSFFLAFLLVFSLTGTALAAVPTGWESLETTVAWETYDGELEAIEYRNLPLENPDLNAIYYYSAKKLMEHFEAVREGSDDRKAVLDFKFSSIDAYKSAYPYDFYFEDIHNKILDNWNSGLMEIYSGLGYREYNEELRFLSLSINVKDDEVTDKLYSIAAEAKAYSSAHYGQLEYINQYLCDNVTYGRGEPMFGSTYAPGTAGQTTKEAIIDGLAVCAGYTSAVNDLCFILGIPSISLLGLNHTWNCVYIDGEWKMLDVQLNDNHDGDRLYDNENIFYDEEGMLNNPNHDYVTYDNEQAINVAKQLALVLHEYSKAKTYVIENEIMTGYGDSQYGLANSLTRAELAVLITRMNGMEQEVLASSAHYEQKCPFIDVPAWAIPYVGYCYEKGLVTGYNETTYGSDDFVTPQAACTIMLRHLGYPETDWNYSTSCDKAAKVGIVSQYYPPGTTALRYDVACILYQASKM